VIWLGIIAAAVISFVFFVDWPFWLSILAGLLVGIVVVFLIDITMRHFSRLKARNKQANGKK